MQHRIMLRRNLIYTAVTRGRRLVVLVGSPRALGLALADSRVERRYTNLQARLRAAAV
jgi:exodeoxyribonuclease V alpha subunit